MNPIPSVSPLGPWPLLVDDFAQIVMVVAVVSLALIFGMLLWSARTLLRERARLHCPVRLEPARVLFRSAPDGERIDVLRCSIFGRKPITCGKVCLLVTQP